MNPIPIQEYGRPGFLISADPAKLDSTAVHDYLSNHSYWAKGISRETVARSLENSLCFGVYALNGRTRQQIGLARVITDYATFGYLSDVYILAEWRGQGLGKWLISVILAHPALQTVRKITLDTRDAHGLYTPFGFQINPTPEKHMVFRFQRTLTSPEQRRRINADKR
jgi:GNAT superfamily N-acetyltransferase